MLDSGLTPDEECFLDHVSGFDFQEGVEAGKWGVLEDESVKWPKVVIWIAAAPRGEAPLRYHLVFDLGHYPKICPTADLWNSETKAKLDISSWPKGEGDVKMAFRTDWNGAVALYAPWDRIAADGHPDWPAKYPGLVWAPGHTIVNYLRPTHALLQSDEYHGN